MLNKKFSLKGFVEEKAAAAGLTSSSEPAGLVGPETSKQRSDSGLEFECYDVQTANILVVGSTGTGKTTFIEGLKDPQYLHQSSVYSSTQEAEAKSILFKINNQFWSINIIDTPGFGDNSVIQKTDLELENLILDFVKKDVTSLNLVLIAIPLGRRLEKSQVSTIMNTLEFLGPGMKSCASILFTFSEDKSVTERKTHVREFKQHADLKSIYLFCQKKFFFTGTCSSPVPIEKQKLINQQKKQQSIIIGEAIRNKASPLRGENYDAVSSRFQVFESAAKDSLLLKKVLPNLALIAKDVEAKRGKLAELAEHRGQQDKYNDVIGKFAEINSQNIEKQCLEWSKLQTAVEQYTTQGGTLQNAAKTVQEQHNALMTAASQLTKACRDCELDLDPEDKSDEDSDSDFDSKF